MLPACLPLCVYVCMCQRPPFASWRSQCIAHDAYPSLPITCATERRLLASDMLCLV